MALNSAIVHYSLTFCILLTLLPRQVLAQMTNATCASEFNWSFNSRQQSPCLIAAYLDSPCLEDPSNAFINALKPNFHYLPRADDPADQCRCNTVMYSVLSACSACQSRLMLPWSGWRENCSQSFIQAYPRPIPVGTSVPAWAYLDVVALDSFNATAAQIESTVNKTEITSPPTATISLSGTATLFSIAATVALFLSPIDNPSTAEKTSQSVTATASLTINKSRTGGIVGGVIGGLSAAVLAVVAYFWCKKRGTKVARVQVPIVVFPSALESPIPIKKRFYNPDDPSTFPDARLKPLRFGEIAEV